MRGVTCAERVRLASRTDPRTSSASRPSAARRRPLKVAAYDFGMKWNILRRLERARLRRARVPGAGAGVRAARHGARRRVPEQRPGRSGALDLRDRQRAALVKADVPVFGICLGHQILGLALGGADLQAEVRPSRRQPSGEGARTARSRSRRRTTVSPSTRVAAGGRRGDALNLYDGTVEGLRHETQAVFCVQYHPEASPGPHDADYLFDDFWR